MYIKRFLSDTSRYAFPRNALIALLGVVLLPLVMAGGSNNNPVGGEGEVADRLERPTTLQVEGTLSQQQVNGGTEA